MDFVSVVTYPDVENLKDIIIKENSNKAGIYIWINLINGKSYVGSAWDLSNRFKQYFRKSFLDASREIKKNRSKIYRALLRYGYSAFKLEILEYCEKDIIIAREQYYLDTINPEYNILKVARSLLGFKHSPESLELMRKIIKEKGSSATPESRLKQVTSLLKGETTIVVNNLTAFRPKTRSLGLGRGGENKTFMSLRKAAEFLDINKSYLAKSKKNRNFI